MVGPSIPHDPTNNESANINNAMLVAIQDALEAVFSSYDWKVVQPTPVIITNLTEEANRRVDAIYERFQVPRSRKFPEDFVSFMIGQLQNYEESLEEQTPRPPAIHEVIRPSLLDDAAEYDPEEPRPNYFDDGSSDKAEPGTVEMPEDWADDLSGNPDAAAWNEAFSTILRFNPHWVYDEGYMIGWHANAIGAGYEAAMQREHPYVERNPESYYYIDFYELEEVEKTDPDSVMLARIRERVAASRGQGESPRERELKEVVKFTFTFATYEAVVTFVRLNEGKAEMPTFYRIYELEPTTTYEKVPIR